MIKTSKNVFHMMCSVIGLGLVRSQMEILSNPWRSRHVAEDLYFLSFVHFCSQRQVQMQGWNCPKIVCELSLLEPPFPQGHIYPIYFNCRNVFISWTSRSPRSPMLEYHCASSLSFVLLIKSHKSTNFLGCCFFNMPLAVFFFQLILRASCS